MHALYIHSIGNNNQPFCNKRGKDGKHISRGGGEQQSKRGAQLEDKLSSGTMTRQTGSRKVIEKITIMKG